MMIQDLRQSLVETVGELQAISQSLEEEKETIERIKGPLDYSPSAPEQMDIMEFYCNMYRLLYGDTKPSVEGSEHEKAVVTHFQELAECWMKSRYIDSERRIEKLERKETCETQTDKGTNYPVFHRTQA